jgi:hypothetical protein
LLTNKKPKVSYFRVFGCKCFILNKRLRTYKFAPKVDEYFLLGYGSKEHTYRTFDKTTSHVEVAVDVTFDLSNGSQEEQVHVSDADQEEAPCDAIKQMGIGDIRPHEDVLEEAQFQPMEDGEVSTEKTLGVVSARSRTVPDPSSARKGSGSATSQNEKGVAGPSSTKGDCLAIIEEDEDE